jgi:hypothetical protein
VTALKANPEARTKWEGPPDAIFEASSTRNVFHFVLDGFQSDVFLDIIEAERADMDRGFSGFTFFADHAGAFPTTIVSIPTMLTGQPYRNQEPMRRFMARAFKRASIFNVMRSQGYQVDAISGLVYDRASATNYYRLPTPYVTYDAYVRFTAWQLADLSLFRHSLHLLKPAIYNNQSWRLQNAFGQENSDTAGRRHFPVNAEAFMRDFTPRLHVTHDRPLYKYVHVGIPHWPMTLTDAATSASSARRASCTPARPGARSGWSPSFSTGCASSASTTAAWCSSRRIMALRSRRMGSPASARRLEVRCPTCQAARLRCSVRFLQPGESVTDNVPAAPTGRPSPRSSASSRPRNVAAAPPTASETR